MRGLQLYVLICAMKPNARWDAPTLRVVNVFDELSGGKRGAITCCF
jgi:hypothetical protein